VNTELWVRFPGRRKAFVFQITHTIMGGSQPKERLYVDTLSRVRPWLIAEATAAGQEIPQTLHLVVEKLETLWFQEKLGDQLELSLVKTKTQCSMEYTLVTGLTDGSILRAPCTSVRYYLFLFVARSSCV